MSLDNFFTKRADISVGYVLKFECEVLLIASTLLVVKTENIYRNTSKMHIMMETELSL